MGFCETCWSCLNGTATPVREPIITDLHSSALLRYVHHADALSLMNAAQQRCKFCTALWIKLTKKKANGAAWLPDSNDLRLLCSVALYAPLDSGAIQFKECMFSFLPVVCGETLPKSFISPSWLLKQSTFSTSHSNRCSASTGSAQTFEIARYWVKACQRDHPACKTGTLKAFYPDRLLDLQDAQANGTFRLIETNSSPISGPYITVSHVWGDGTVTKLTSANEAMLKNGSKIANLSRTFQHAIAACTSLHCRYLWIDSLCIMQDAENPIDWLNQSPHMDRIYSSALCNLAASASTNSHGGLFRERNIPEVEWEDIELAPEAAYRVLEAGTYRLAPYFDWEDSVENAPLNRRAWVFQERILAPRTLCFIENQVAWECPTMRACESFPDGLPSNFDSGRLKSVTRHLSLNDQARKRQSARDKWPLYCSWHQVHLRYSSCFLTYSDDRALAISGVAKRFERLLQDRYLAGMWKSKLVSDLIWHTRQEDPRPQCLTRRQYCAPSWSWLSLERNALAYYGLDFEEDDTPKPWLYEILDIQLQYVTADTTGLLASGEIVLKGFLIPVHLTRSDPPEQFAYWKVLASGDEIHASVYPDYGRENLPVHGSSAEKKEHFCLAAAVRQDFENVMCFLLELVDGSRGTFRRIGLVLTSMAEKGLLELVATHLTEHSLYPAMSYDEREEKHVIRVV